MFNDRTNLQKVRILVLVIVILLLYWFQRTHYDISKDVQSSTLDKVSVSTLSKSRLKFSFEFFLPGALSRRKREVVDNFVGPESVIPNPEAEKRNNKKPRVPVLSALSENLLTLAQKPTKAPDSKAKRKDVKTTERHRMKLGLWLFPPYVPQTTKRSKKSKIVDKSESEEQNETAKPKGKNVVSGKQKNRLSEDESEEIRKIKQKQQTRPLEGSSGNVVKTEEEKIPRPEAVRESTGGGSESQKRGTSTQSSFFKYVTVTTDQPVKSTKESQSLKETNVFRNLERENGKISRKLDEASTTARIVEVMVSKQHTTTKLPYIAKSNGNEQINDDQTTKISLPISLPVKPKSSTVEPVTIRVSTERLAKPKAGIERLLNTGLVPVRFVTTEQPPTDKLVKSNVANGEQRNEDKVSEKPTPKTISPTARLVNVVPTTDRTLKTTERAEKVRFSTTLPPTKPSAQTTMVSIVPFIPEQQQLRRMKEPSTPDMPGKVVQNGRQIAEETRQLHEGPLGFTPSPVKPTKKLRPTTTVSLSNMATHTTPSKTKQIEAEDGPTTATMPTTRIPTTPSQGPPVTVALIPMSTTTAASTTQTVTKRYRRRTTSQTRAPGEVHTRQPLQLEISPQTQQPVVETTPLRRRRRTTVPPKTESSESFQTSTKKPVPSQPEPVIKQTTAQPKSSTPIEFSVKLKPEPKEKVLSVEEEVESIESYEIEKNPVAEPVENKQIKKDLKEDFIAEQPQVGIPIPGATDDDEDESNDTATRKSEEPVNQMPNADEPTMSPMDTITAAPTGNKDELPLDDPMKLEEQTDMFDSEKLSRNGGFGMFGGFGNSPSKKGNTTPISETTTIKSPLSQPVTQTTKNPINTLIQTTPADLNVKVDKGELVVSTTARPTEANSEDKLSKFAEDPDSNFDSLLGATGDESGGSMSGFGSFMGGPPPPPPRKSKPTTTKKPTTRPTVQTKTSSVVPKNNEVNRESVKDTNDSDQKRKAPSLEVNNKLSMDNSSIKPFAVPSPVPVSAVPLPVTSIPVPLIPSPVPVSAVPVPVTSMSLPLIPSPVPVASSRVPVQPSPVPVVPSGVPVAPSAVPRIPSPVPVTPIPVPVVPSPVPAVPVAPSGVPGIPTRELARVPTFQEQSSQSSFSPDALASKNSSSPVLVTTTQAAESGELVPSSTIETEPETTQPPVEDSPQADPIPMAQMPGSAADEPDQPLEPEQMLPKEDAELLSQPEKDDLTVKENMLPDLNFNNDEGLKTDNMDSFLFSFF